MTVYDILFYFAIFAFVGSNVALIVVRPLKNRYAHRITNDVLFKAYKDDYGYNDIYATTGETRNFINRYVLRTNHSTKTLICNYTKYFNEISYHVVCLDKNCKPIKVFNAHESNVKTKTSVIYLLPSNCVMVNVVIQSAEGVSYNDKVIAPITKSNCRFYTLFSSAILISLMYILRHVLVLLLGSGYEEAFFLSPYNIITLILMGATTVVYALMTLSGLRRRNYKTKIGGSLEYEFF